MAADLTCVVLDTAAELTELVLDLAHVTELMRANGIGLDEARQLVEEAEGLVRAWGSPFTRRWRMLRESCRGGGRRVRSGPCAGRARRRGRQGP